MSNFFKGFVRVVTRNSPSSLLASQLVFKPSWGVGMRPGLSHTNWTSQSCSLLQQQRNATINQTKKRGSFKTIKKRKKAMRSKAPALERAPQKRGVIVRVMILKPRKPNSANRKACRVRLSTGKVITAHIPGEGHNAQDHHVVTIRGGRAQDLPGVKYKCIRGLSDMSGVPNRRTSRSKYGSKWIMQNFGMMEL